MISFDAYDLIALWEKQQTLSPAEQALLLLALARPRDSREALGNMTIGERDRILLDMRRQLFSDQLESLAHCSNCDETLEIALAISEFLSVATSADAAARSSLRVGEFDIVFRLPTVADAIAIERNRALATARLMLQRRCIVAARKDGSSVDPQELDEITLARISRAMEKMDPLSEIRLSITCTNCEHSESILLDIASYLWAELRIEAERLLDEVQLLAREFGWREMDIVAMSGVRRQYYLDRRTT